MSGAHAIFWDALKTDYNVPIDVRVFPEGGNGTKYSAWLRVQDVDDSGVYVKSLTTTVSRLTSYQPPGGWEYAAKLTRGTKGTVVEYMLPQLVETDWLGHVWGIWYDPPLAQEKISRNQAIQTALASPNHPSLTSLMDPISPISVIGAGQPIPEIILSKPATRFESSEEWGIFDYLKLFLAGVAVLVVTGTGAYVYREIKTADRNDKK